MIAQKLISSVLGLSLLSLAAAGCGTATGAAVDTGAGAAPGAAPTTSPSTINNRTADKG